MRRVPSIAVLIFASLLFVPAASGLTLTLHSPTPDEYYNGTAPLNWTASEPVNITKTYNSGAITRLTNTTGETKAIAGTGQHTLTLNATAYHNASETATATVQFAIGSTTALNSCTDMLTGGTYTLNTDIRNHKGGCFFIEDTGTPVTLDCQGHIIDGNGTATPGHYGIDIASTTTPRTVKRCAIQNFCAGLDLRHTSGVTLNASFLTNNEDEGVCAAVRVDHDRDTTITGTRFVDNGETFDGQDFGPSSLEPNRIYNNAFRDAEVVADSGVLDANNQWFVSPRSGNRIVGTGDVGGNLWSNLAADGFSDRCEDTDPEDGFCDDNFDVEAQTRTASTGNNIDEHPYSVEQGTNPTIDASTVEINPFPVETGQQAEVCMDVSGMVTGVAVARTVNGDDRTRFVFTPANGDRWCVPVPPIPAFHDRPGTRVDLLLLARNRFDGAGTDIVTETEAVYPDTELPVAGEKARLHYHLFRDVINVPVILARFQGQNPTGPGTEFDTDEDIRQWKRAREYDINSYYGSGRGSMGAVGFDFEYKDNNLGFYEVGPETDYDDESNRKDTIEFTNDAQNSAGVTKPFIATNPGDPFVGARFIPAFTESEDGEIGADGNKRVYAAMKKRQHHYGVWIHELGHFEEGLGDIYAEENNGDVAGGIKGFGVMGGFESYGDPREPDEGKVGRITQLFSGLSRTALNNGDWLSLTEVDLDTDPSFSSDFPLDAITGKTLGDDILVFNTQKQNGNGNTVKYVPEARGINQPESGAIIIFKIAQDGTLLTKANVIQNPDCDRNTGEAGNCALGQEGQSIQDRITAESDVFLNFTLSVEAGSGKNYAAAVNIDPTPHEADRTVGALEDPINVSPVDVDGSEPLNVTTPDLDLKAVDEQGRVVGRNASGVYVNEIPGADASGDRLQGLEWISVPDNSTARFVVDSTDILRFAEDLNLSANETAELVQTVNVTTINYGENPQLVEGPEVNDTVSTEVPVTIGAGEQITTSIPAEIDVDPDTVNLRSQGRWITAYVELPEGFNMVEEDGENTTAVNISTVKLNGEVSAVDDDRFGFVTDPKLGDRDGDGLPELMVKFPRDAVRPLLGTGKEKMTVTGKTVEGRIFSGSDRIRVIERGNDSTVGPIGGLFEGVVGAVTAYIPVAALS